MKLIRFVTASGDAVYGIADSGSAREARVVSGDLFTGVTGTDRIERVTAILPPLDPVNILCLGWNYGKHAEETHERYPEMPVVFIKATSSVIAHGSPIVLPKAGPDEVDYEAELAVIIGKRANNVSPESAEEYILGYTCANDVSARDWQLCKQNGQWARGKSFDTFCPLGPCIVTREEVPEPNNLRIRSFLNGRVMQDSRTSDMLFSIPTIVSDLSRSMTLLPGTVILTGTPEGVGFTREPPVFLGNGDEVTVAIEAIGELTNPVVAEA